MIKEIPLIIKGYKSFKPLILHNKKNFVFLIIFFCIEVVILASSVLTTIPLVDFILDPDLKTPNKFTLILVNILGKFNIDSSLFVFLFLFVFSNIIKGFMTILIYIIVLGIKNNIEYKYVNKLSTAVLNSNWKFFQDKDVGIFTNTATKITHSISEGFSQIALQVSFLFRFFIYMAIPLIINWKLCFIALLISLIFAYPLKYLNVFGDRWGKLNVKYDNLLYKSINETFSSIKLILGYNLQKFSINRISSNLNKTLSFAKKRLSTETFIIYIMQPIALLSASATFYIFYKEQGDLVNLAAIFWSLVSGLPILSNLLKGNFSIVSLQPSIAQFDNLIFEANKINPTENKNKKIISNFKEKIIFDKVDFSYDNNDKILENLSLQINRNEFILIKGSSGNGKSTLLDLIMGFQMPSSGNIIFDEHNLKDINIKSIREIIGYVPQEPILFDGTIIQNLEIVNDKLTKNEITEVLKKSNCEEFINNFDNGINTLVGERGKNISGGQRQRIALARALVKKPQILVLDEPTNSLDKKSSDLIYSSIKNLKNKMTIILISHEDINIDLVDKIYLLENKKLVKIN